MMQHIIEHNFTYHKPTEQQIPLYEQLRAEGKKLALLIDRVCPTSREKSLAITKLEESIMWANAAIARNTERSTNEGTEQFFK